MQFRNFLALLGMAVSLASCSAPCDTDNCVDTVYVHRYGVKVRPDYWVEKGQNGNVITTSRDGVITTQSYRAGELHGECTYTFPNSNKISRSALYDSNKMKKESHFYRSGAPRECTEWFSDKCCTVTKWYECGAVHSVEKFEDGRLISGEYFTRDRHRDSWVYAGEGERMTRDCLGVFLCKDDFRGGELALRTYYYPNGGPREIASYCDGVIHGERKTYYQDGSPCSIESWECGRQNGTTVIFQNGDRYAEIPYLDGKKNGVERRYADGYNLSQEITWYDNQMHGPMCTYVGDSVKEDWFYKGRMTSQSNFESYYTPCN